jgi:hypothetical protein
MAEAPVNMDGSRKPGRGRRWVLRILGVLFGLFLLLGMVIVMAWWNMVRMPGTSFQGTLPAADDALRSLAAELRQDLVRLATEIGERNIEKHPQSLTQAAEWIEGELTKAGYEVHRQEYDVSGTTCCNIEAELWGTKTPDEIIVIGAHYDSAWGTPGADDNGSGIVGVLALARRFAQQKTDRTIRFVAFVNEELPYFQTEQMGSWVYAKRCRQRNEKIVTMFSLEMLGYFSDEPGSQNYPSPLDMLYPTTGNFIGFVGNMQSSGLVQQVVAAFRQFEPFPAEGGAPPEAIPGVGFSDHWSFWQEGYPALMVTDTAMYRYRYYHEAEDTPDKIDYERMARVVRGLEKVIAMLAHK